MFCMIYNAEFVSYLKTKYLKWIEYYLSKKCAAHFTYYKLTIINILHSSSQLMLFF